MLLEKYFDASISPMEMDRLEAAAKDVAAGKLACHDKETADSLRLINSISRYAESSIERFADSLPTGLEDRLSSHISMLAAKDKCRDRRPWLNRIVSYSAAAAAVGIIAISGYHYMSVSDDLSTTNNLDAPSSVIIASAPSSIMIAVAPSEEADPKPASSGIAPICRQLSQPKTTAMAKTPRHTPRKQNKEASPTMAAASYQTLPSLAAASDQVPHFIVDEYAKEADKALSGIPPFKSDILTLSEEAFRVMPTGLTAYVDTSELLTQPISTLSQSINSIYESVEIMSEAFSGVATALEAAGNSLALLADPI